MAFFISAIFIISVAIVSTYGQDVSSESPTTQSSEAGQQMAPGQSAMSAEWNAKRKAEQQERKRLSNSYQSMYFKLCSETYNKMKAASEECSTEMKMVR